MSANKKTILSLISFFIVLVIASYYLFNKSAPDIIKITNKDKVIVKNEKSVAVENETVVKNNIKDITKSDDIISDKKVIAIDPLTFTSEYEGVFSLDLHTLSKLKKGDVIKFPYNDTDLSFEIDDIYTDNQGKVIYGLNNLDGGHSVWIFSPDTGESYVHLYSKNLEFETHLDSNGVGSFQNIRKGDKMGLKPYENDTL